MIGRSSIAENGWAGIGSRAPAASSRPRAPRAAPARRDRRGGRGRAGARLEPLRALDGAPELVAAARGQRADRRVGAAQQVVARRGGDVLAVGLLEQL